MNTNNEMKRSEEKSLKVKTKRAQIVDKVLNTTNKQNNNPLPSTAVNGINGCCDACDEEEDNEQDIDGQHSQASANGIRLLCEAANAVEAEPNEPNKKCRQQMNGLIVNHNERNNKLLFSDNSSSGQTRQTQTNSCCNCHLISTTSATTTTTSTSCCRMSSSSSATTSCCSTSSATLSCDIINNKESVVHPIDDNKDVNCLTNRLSTDLNINELNDKIVFVNYESERQMPDIMRLIQKDLSEPYSIYTYRYFIHNWPHLCFLAMDCDKCVGAIVCKLDLHKKMVRRGYIAMLAVDENYRKRKIGSNLVLRAIQAMIAGDADEVVLETEVTNKPALQLYENLGFVRDKRLFRYYLNGVDALRLKLWLK